MYPEWDDEWSVPVGVPEDADTPETSADWDPGWDVGQNGDAHRQEIQSSWTDFRRKMVENGFVTDDLLDGVEKVYSTCQAARFFGRSTQWIYWGLRNGIFVYKDGTPIQPERIGSNGRRRYTLPILREIALSVYRRGNMNEDELQAVMAKILIAEFGERAFS